MSNLVSQFPILVHNAEVKKCVEAMKVSKIIEEIQEDRKSSCVV